MKAPTWWAIAAVAVGGFWVLGAYNRLVGLRSAVGAAWSRADEILRQRGEATERLVAAWREPLAAEQGALDALLAAHAQVARAAGTMGARPLHAPNAAECVATEARFTAAAARVASLIEGTATAAASAESPAETDTSAPDTLRAWREASEKWPFARQLYNDAAAAHDAAVALFPTSVVARLFAFGPCGRL